MKIVSHVTNDQVASVYLADFGQDRWAEFVESVQPPIPRDKKWVLIVSTLFGCPVGCKMCDAGDHYRGKVSEHDMFAQIDFLVRRRYPDGRVPAEKFKIQFARMGDPAFNQDVLSVLERLPGMYDSGGLIPSVSTVAPKGCDSFFDGLLALKQRTYAQGRFQMQFSIHSTDPAMRDWLTPIKKWDFPRISDYGQRFHQNGDRKITLNFALARDVAVESQVLLKYFDPDTFIIKITPINPTYSTVKNKLASYIDPHDRQADSDKLLQELRSVGYDVLLSIGEVEENKIGSNCGQYLRRHLDTVDKLDDAYTYAVQTPSADRQPNLPDIATRSAGIRA